ncbi:hypothetical protein [Rhodococcus sp. UNC363MFTsu5.1]|uniref:hypothetical protein n=1 Tax=Rhodococcus sp. UNC363MFTsu5.1 TaxID=1449069 RepID=UPI0012DD4D12|nr:hypothetical protein [Rhodococcus sp. UNC363MFTsu5.1]
MPLPVEEFDVTGLLAESRMYLERLADRGSESLAVINPVTVANWSYFGAALCRVPGAQLLIDGGIDRFIWMVGCAGSGTGRVGSGLVEFLNLCVYWRAGQILAGMLESLASPDAGGTNASAALNSVFPARARFRWATIEMSKLLIRHTDLSGVSESAVDSLTFYLECIDRENLWASGNCGAAPLTGEARLLVEDCSIAMGVLSNESFASLAFDRRMDTHPFVNSEGVLVPVAAQKLLSESHLMVFGYLRRRVGQHSVATAFEASCASMVAKLCDSTSFRVLHSSVAVKVGNHDPGEVDFAVTDDRKNLVLGEVKSNVVGSSIDTTEQLLAKQVSKAVEQLDVRIQAFKSGSPLTQGCEQVQVPSSAKVIGMVVTLHDYGGAVWNSQDLDRSLRSKARFAVTTAHDLALLAHTLTGIDELLAYLDFRERFLSHSAVSMDELDILAAFLEDEDGIRKQFNHLSAISNVRAIMKPRNVDRELLLCTEAPEGCTSWRQVVAGLPAVPVW